MERYAAARRLGAGARVARRRPGVRLCAAITVALLLPPSATAAPGHAWRPPSGSAWTAWLPPSGGSHPAAPIIRLKTEATELFRQQPPAAATDKPVDSGVRSALQQYAEALESLDAEAVKKVQPSIDVEGLKRAFREMRALEVDIDNIRLLSGNHASARVSCRVAQTLTPKAGSRQTTTVTRVLRLQRQDTGWIIQSFER